MNQPSSTITAATLTQLIMVAFWAGMNLFYFPAHGYALTPELVAFEGAVTVAISATAGYFKKETVYTMSRKIT